MNVVLVGVDGLDDDVGSVVFEFANPLHQKFPDTFIENLSPILGRPYQVVITVEHCVFYSSILHTPKYDVTGRVHQATTRRGWRGFTAPT